MRKKDKPCVWVNWEGEVLILSEKRAETKNGWANLDFFGYLLMLVILPRNGFEMLGEL
jgi:hypothetical protein